MHENGASRQTNFDKKIRQFVKNQQNSLYFDRIDTRFCLLNIETLEENHLNHTLNYKISKVILSEAHVKIKITPKRNIVFILVV